jgi:type I restriction enzyme, S subunit
VIIYNRQEIVEFQKNDGPYAGLSNMMSGYTLRVNDVNILTSEALYQACKLPNHPEYQQDIIETKSPMAAKMKSRKYGRYVRPDWKDVQVQVMDWCLRVKLAQNWNSFSNDLLDTAAKPIVELSNRDVFWAAKPIGESTLQGQNVLGNLLMELRSRLKNCDPSLETVEPLSIPDFTLYEHSITLVKPFPKQEQGRLEL